MSEPIVIGSGLELSRLDDGNILIRATEPAHVVTPRELAAGIGRVSNRGAVGGQAERDASEDALIVLQLPPEREIGDREIGELIGRGRA